MLEGSGSFIAPLASISSVKAASIGPFTLNLVNVPVAEAAKAVIGNILEASYVVDDRVKGTVSIQTPSPVDAQTLVRMFETSLRSSGAVLVQEAAYFRIVPAEAGAFGSLPVQSGRGSGQIGQRVQIVPLKFVSAKEMERILRPIARKEGIVGIDSVRNIVTLSGSDQEIATLLDTVSVFDVDWMKGMSFGLVPLTTSDPEVIAAELDTMFFNDKDGPSKGVLRFVPSRRLNAILIITSQPKYLAPAEKWVRRLDAASREGEEQLYVYSIKNRPASELAAILKKVFSTESETVSAAPQAAATTSAVAPRLSASTVSSPSLGALAGSPRQIEAPPARIPEPAGVGSEEPAREPGAIKPKIKVVADEANNSLLITARAVDYKRVLKALERIDVVSNQVLLEATIFEVSLNDQLKFGLRWHFEKGASSTTFANVLSGAVAPAFPGFSYFFSASDVKVAVNALAAITSVKVISSPSLMVVDNKTAVLQVGDQVPITTQTAQSTLTPGAPIVNSVQYHDTGVILSVTPRVSESGRVTLTIEQEVSDVAKTTSSGIDSPTIQQRRIKTTVAVKDGESLALGGLMQQRKKVEKGQLPILGDVPVLGAVFRDKTDTREETELLIVITPRVVRNDEEARSVTNEFRQRLNLGPMEMTSGRPGVHENLNRILRD